MLTTQAHVFIDLRSINLPEQQFSGHVDFDTAGVPLAIRLEVPFNTSDDVLKLLFNESDRVCGCPITALCVDARRVESQISFVRSKQMTSTGGLNVEVLPDSCTITPNAATSSERAEWRFQLTNCRLRFGDEVTTKLAFPDDDPEKLTLSRRLNVVRFVAGDREWELIDDTHGEWKSGKAPNAHVPIVTSTLRTQAHPDDSKEDVCNSAFIICRILTLALSRSVRWVSCTELAAGGVPITSFVPNVLTQPYNQAGFAAVDNWTPGTLKTLIERAYPVIAADLLWWRTTLELFMQVHTSKHLEVKATILNVLADRISSRLGIKATGSEIDVDLPGKLKGKDFQSQLHVLFEQLTPAWTKDRTQRLIDTVTNWNAEPSFPIKVQRACEAVGLKPPSKKFLGVRHPLLHQGNLVVPEGNGGEMKYWLELEALILMLILRMLNYSGLIYHAHFGHQPTPLKDHLAHVPGIIMEEL